MKPPVQFPVLLSAATLLTAMATVAYGQDPPLGSTAAIEQLKFDPPPPNPDEPTKDQTVLTISAAAEVVPALRYRFWPHPDDLHAARGETHFYRAIMFYREIDREARFRAEGIFLEDFDNADPDAVKKYLEQAESTILELRELSLSADQSWDLGIRKRKGLDWYSFLLPDVQESRALARLLLLQAKQQLAEDDFDGLVETLQIGFRLAGFVGQGEVMVQQLVGLAIQGVFLEMVEDAITHPECPNLYWALASIPRPLCDLRRSTEFEASSMLRVFPFLELAKEGHLTDEQWRQKMLSMGKELQKMSGPKPMMIAAMALLVGSQAQAEFARERLLAAGYSAADLEHRGQIDLIALDTHLELKTIQDDMTKGALLPADRRSATLKRSKKSIRDQRGAANGGQPSIASVLAGLLLPATHAAMHAGTRTQFNLNRLLTIEAIRDQLAQPPGRFPASLESLTRLPAFDDPFTGNPLQYELDDSVQPAMAVITAVEDLRWPPKQKTILIIRP